MKLHDVVSLRFGLKEAKIAMNIKQFGIHSYLTYGHLNLRSNFNSEKLVKSETSSCAFAKVALKGSENSMEPHEIWRAFYQPWFEHPLMRAKIAPNRIKIGVHAYL